MTTQDTGEQALWGLEDYAIWVPMSDNFYKTLPFAKITLEQFERGGYTPQRAYNDSRTYLRLILAHLGRLGAAAQVLDVGGYIGRFSIEAALACAELELDDCTVTCFEPGATHDLLAKNLVLNRVDERVALFSCAISDREASARFAIPGHAKITSRIVVGAAAEASHERQGFAISDVPVRPLSDFLQPGRPFVAKIDTEGHEASVINGIPADVLYEVPHVLVIEFWPAVLNAKIHGEDFARFVLDNYVVLNIESALYPRNYDILRDFDGVCEVLNNKEANNLDLMLVNRNTPGHEDLVKRIISVGE